MIPAAVPPSAKLWWGGEGPLQNSPDLGASFNLNPTNTFLSFALCVHKHSRFLRRIVERNSGILLFNYQSFKSVITRVRQMPLLSMAHCIAIVHPLHLQLPLSWPGLAPTKATPL